MPANYGNRRLEESIGAEGQPLPPETYAPPQRYVISLLGIVIAVQTVPYGVQPTLTLGQLATLSLTLQIGDKV